MTNVTGFRHLSQPTLHSVLDSLPRLRLVELGRHFNVGVDERGTRDAHLATLSESGQLRLRQLVEWRGRDELRRACQRHGLDPKATSRPILAGRLLEASGAPDSAAPIGIFGGRDFKRHAPRAGDIVQVRQRQYLVEAVAPPPEPHHATLVDLVCLDDDNQGKPQVSSPDGQGSLEFV